jgi:hypothetical protein
VGQWNCRTISSFLKYEKICATQQFERPRHGYTLLPQRAEHGGMYILIHHRREDGHGASMELLYNVP